MLGEPENQFSLTRVALSTRGCAKSEFLSAPRRAASASAFTLIELLVVIAIILENAVRDLAKGCK
jgi:prepilin-type N-terminal cleavage/methylation domain-containing protein